MRHRTCCESSLARRTARIDQRRAGSFARTVMLLIAVASGLYASMEPSAAAAEASSNVTSAQAAAFRARVLADMQAALGARIRVRQDAINAAYFRVGWSWGEDTTTALDNAAYKQARAWGFSIRDFTRAGRHERFSVDQLAEHALTDEEAAPELSPQAPIASVATPEAAKGERADSWVDALERRVSRAAVEVDALTGDVGQLEHDVRSYPPTSKERKSEIRVAIAALERLLDKSERELDQCSKALVGTQLTANP